jgi:cytochrome c biogenesis protein
VGVDIHHNPGQLSALIFALLAVAGLVTSLYVNRRRVWVRTGTHEDGRTMVEYGLLARGEDHRLAGEAARIRTLLMEEWELSDNAPDGGPDPAGTASATDSQTAPSGTADNDRADADTPGASRERAPQDHPEADFIPSSAGSPESKKDS